MDGRNESVEERLDRNWNELMQELRVMQTGAQILAAFLVFKFIKGMIKFAVLAVVVLALYYFMTGGFGA